MPTPVRRASSGGGSVPPPEPPQGATATMAKTPFFFVTTRLRRTLSAMDYVLADSRGKGYSAPAYADAWLEPLSGVGGATLNGLLARRRGGQIFHPFFMFCVAPPPPCNEKNPILWLRSNLFRQFKGIEGIL